MPRPRRSLLLRLLAGAVLVAICSTAATAWLTARSTTVAIREQSGRSLADDTSIYDTLLGWAASHPDWNSVGPVVERLSRSTGRRIVVTTEARAPVAGTPEDLPATASAVIDPLAVDPAILSDAPADRIDPRAVGPYALSAADAKRLKAAAEAVLDCVRYNSGVGAITVDPAGRPHVEGATQDVVESCETKAATQEAPGPAADSDAAPRDTTRIPLSALTPGEKRAIDALRSAVDSCMEKKHEPAISVDTDFSWVPATARDIPDEDAARDCLTASRRAQLAPYVAPPALLFVDTPAQATRGFDLSTRNVWRLAGVAALVLAFTLAVAVLGGLHLIQPLRELTRAARRMSRGEENIRVAVRRDDEIGELSRAFNDLADRREHTEGLRRAMVSDIAHELRTPLSNIRGWLEALEDGVAEPDAEFVSILGEESALLQRIVDDLHDLATIDAGTLRIHPERLHLGTALEQLAASYRGRAEAAGVRLIVSAREDLELDADPFRLRQATGNLVANGIRHTPAGGTVTVSGRSEPGAVVIEVADTGEGIASENLGRVFDRFWRAESSRGRRGGGSGLGLAIVRSMVEAHGGSATAASSPGRGARFTLRFPEPGSQGEEPVDL